LREKRNLTAPWTVEEFTLVDNISFALKKLSNHGFNIYVATNQPDVAHGNLSPTILQNIHSKMESLLPEIQGIYVCPHSNGEGCFCRKPKDGLIQQVFLEHDLSLKSSWMIGDRWVDIAAANSFKLRSVLISSEESWKPNSSGAPSPEVRPTFEVRDILSAAELIIKEST
jgi:D-glycero-D-manno-heptose 1,7-bisphosphate phosphatase